MTRHKPASARVRIQVHGCVLYNFKHVPHMLTLLYLV